MAGLYDILANAQNGEAIERLSRQFNLSPQQTEDAVAALLPAISRGLKHSTETPDGLAGLLQMMAGQQGLYDDAEAALGANGREAGNAALGAMFGSKDVSRAVAAQAQQATGVGSDILRKMLPVVIGLIMSGLLKNLGGGAQGRQAPAPGGGLGGGLGDILGQVLGGGRGAGQAPGGGGSGGGGGLGGGLGDILGQVLGGGRGGAAPDLGSILRDVLGGGARQPGGTAAPPAEARPADRGAPPREMKELSDLSDQLSPADGYGQKLFGEMLEPGHAVDRGHEQNIAQLFDQIFGGRR